MLISALRLVLTRMESGVSTSISHLLRLNCLAFSRLERCDTLRALDVWHTSALTEEDELEVELCGLAGQRSLFFSSQEDLEES